ncbi:hypothetical protein [Trujillonella endophytica]|uniref:Uncharacterized protein n=1 Tax=Trujillonella endophytica TaxID=673521 RepID=A0A1H8T6U3_9ACTN|nr:hypothetical protein [Trujillella endophytica]SEO86314.1 hypothetical protein SAMN05660991_02090 [Trujillella endophytica]
MPSLCRATRSLPAVVVATTLLVSGCGADGDDGGGLPTAPGGAAADDSVAGMLALLPPMDDDEIGIVTVSRWHAAAEAYGVPVPPAGADRDAVLDYLVALSTGDGGLAPASALLDLRTAASASTQEEFGFAPQAVAADVSAGLPPQVVSAARGDFDVDAIGEATRSGPVAVDVEEVEVGGVPVLRWREDHETDFDQVTALSPIGSAGRLGLPDEETLLYATDDDGIEALADAARGGESLADDEDLAAVAGALDAEDVLAAQLTPRPEGSDLTYEAVGIGLAWDGAARVVLAWSTDSGSDAQALASSVEELVTSGESVATGRPWADLLGDPDVRVDGSLVTAVLTLEGAPGRWATFLLQRENLF